MGELFQPIHLLILLFLLAIVAGVIAGYSRNHPIRDETKASRNSTANG